MSKSEEIANNILNNVKTLEKKASLYDEIVKIHGSVEDFRQRAERFYSKTMTVNEVADLYEVDVRTIRSYIDMNLIPAHPKSTDGKKLIRVSDVLMLDFPTLKRQASRKNKKEIIDSNSLLRFGV